MGRFPRIVFLLLVGGVVPLRGQVATPQSMSLDALVSERVARGAAVGLIVGRIDAGRPEVVAKGSSGSAGRPLNERTIVEIGSVSKVFTTILLADMVLRGEVRLDDPVQRFLPASVRVPERNGRAITLLDLATATSGLPRLPTLTPADSTNPYADFTTPQLYTFLAGVTLPRDPGTRYEYSNLGMGLLGHALALRGGKSYEALVTERVLHPLGMRDTRIRLTPAQASRFAIGHGADFDPVGHWDFDVLAGAGGWRSTPADMMRFVAAVATPPTTPVGKAIALSIASQRPTGMPNLSIGLGWHILTRPDRAIVWHNGETGGFHSFVGVDPRARAGVMVLANTAVDNDDLGFHLLDPTAPLRPLPPVRVAMAVDSATLERLTGEYALAPGVMLRVTRTGAALYAQLTGQSRFRVFALAPLRFFYRVVDAEISFQVDPDGRPTGLTLHQGGEEIPGKRITP